jgi:hypothetical protein
VKAKPLIVVSAVMAISAAGSSSSETSGADQRLRHPERPAWMSADKAIQKRVSLDERGIALGKLLLKLSAACGARITVCRDLRDQRISITANDTPAAAVMASLSDTCSHGKWAPCGVQWNRTGGPAGVPEYELYITQGGRREAAALLLLTEKTATRWLRELRDFAAASPEDKATIASDCPVLSKGARPADHFASEEGIPMAEALAGLTDSQLGQLFQTGRLTLDDNAISDRAIDGLKGSLGANPASKSNISAKGATLRVESTPDDGQYHVSVSFSSPGGGGIELGLRLDTLGTGLSDQRLREIEAAMSAENAQPINLLRSLPVEPGKTPAMTLTRALELWAREAHASLTAEVFIRSRRPLRVSEGKPEYLLSDLCMQFGCDWGKVGDRYIVWSTSWAQDRRADVPDKLLSKWLSNKAANGHLQLEDLLGIVRLTDYQLSVARIVFGDLSVLQGANLTALRLTASLPLAVVQGAFSPRGSELEGLNPVQTEVARILIGRPQVTPPIRLRLSAYDGGVDFTLSDSNGAIAARRFAFDLFDPNSVSRARH